MKCRYCNVALSPLRSLTDGEFCCDNHRRAFENLAFQPEPGRAERAEVPDAGAGPVTRVQVSEERGPAAPAGSSAQDLRAIAQNMSAFDFQPPQMAPAARGQVSGNGPESAVGATQPGQVAVEPATPEMFRPSSLEPGAYQGSNYEAQPNFTGSAPAEGLEFEDGEASEDAGQTPSHPSYEVLNSRRWLNVAWHKAPRDLKILLVALPVLVTLAVGPSVPKVKVKVSPVAANNVQQIVVTQWKDLQQTISNRAAVAFSDDFRSGLDAWQSRSNLTRSWSYDASGFVRPGPLAVFKPTTDLSDYRCEFLEEIDQRGLGFAFRAADLENYYAVKLVVVRPGPLPIVHLVRYAVIKGKEGPHVEKPLPFTTRADTLYRMLVDVRGGDFTIMVQGQIVDFWSDNRLRQGGIGFFCSRGEKARLRWVEVSHQYDALGRLCAYLAPYGIDVKNGSLN